MDKTEFVRSLPFTIERSVEDGDGLTMSGYAAVFNQPARINSWEGNFDEVILPGAFAESLRNQTPTLLFDHGHHPLVGTIPIGKYTDIREDDRGLYVEARLHNNWLTEPIRDAIRERSVTGMSFRFLSNKTVDTWTERKGDVPLREISATVVPEMGPVTFPAYAGTEVGVRQTMMSGPMVGAPAMDPIMQGACQQILNNLNQAEEALDLAQQQMAEMMGVPNPDSENSATPEGETAAARPADAEEAVAEDDLTGQSVARSSDGSDATPNTKEHVRHRTLILKGIL